MTRLTNYLNQNPKVSEAVWNLLGEIEEGAIAESVSRWKAKEDHTDPEVIRDEVIDTIPIHEATEALALSVIESGYVQERIYEEIVESIRDDEVQKELEEWRP